MAYLAAGRLVFPQRAASKDFFATMAGIFSESRQLPVELTARAALGAALQSTQRASRRTRGERAAAGADGGSAGRGR